MRMSGSNNSNTSIWFTTLRFLLEVLLADEPIFFITQGAFVYVALS